MDTGQKIVARIAWGAFVFLALGLPALALGDAGRPPPVEVIVCGGHDQALAHWLAAAQRGVLPRRGVGILHYDAHPDMGVPDTALSRGWPADINDFMAGVNIATFQLAAVRTGLVDRIIWLRPPWAEQFKDGRYAFHLGESADGTLKVNQDSDYYAANGAWAPLATLRHTTALIFEVARYDADMARLAPFAGPVVLDIDLDIFSTFNPGAEALRRAGLTQAEIDDIAERFSLENLWLSKNPKKRNEEIRDLKADIASLLTGPWYAGLAALPRLFRLGVGPRDLYKVYAAVEKMPPETLLDTIITNFEYAIGLPEHLSSQAEIDRILEAMDTFLTSGGFRPALVTIARSVEGGYTPPEVCARVEKRLIRILRNALGRIALRYDRMLASEPTL